MKRPGAGGPPNINPNEKAKIDEEYMSLMAELGVRVLMYLLSSFLSFL